MWRQKFSNFINQDSGLDWIIIIVGSFALFIAHSLCFKGWIIDDAGIAFAYARNLIQGFGFVSQPGVEPVEGFSDPLWVFILSPFFINSPLDPTPIAKGISLFFVFWGFILVSFVSRLLFPETAWAKLLTLAVLLSLSINTSFVIWTSSGLENPLYFFLVTFYCFICLKYVLNPSNKISVYAGLTCAGLTLTRPDGIVFAGVFPVLIRIKSLKADRQGKGFGMDLFLFLLAFLIPTGLYQSFRLIYFKDILPNTYWVKGAGGFSQSSQFYSFAHFYKKTISLLQSMVLPSWRWSLYLATIISILFSLRSLNKSLLGTLFLITAATLCIYCLLPYDWMPEYRFATPFIYCLYLLVFTLLGGLFKSMRFMPEYLRVMLFFLFTSFSFLQSLQVYSERTKKFSREPTVPFSTVARSSAFQTDYNADVLKIQNPTFLGPDMGGTLYYSRARAYDLAGLCDRTIGRTINRDIQGLRDYVFETVKPTFIYIHDGWSFNPDLYSDPRFAQFYMPLFEQKKADPVNDKKLTLLKGFYVRKGSYSEDDLAWLKKHPYDSRTDIIDFKIKDCAGASHFCCGFL